ncbi:hypothetical protein [Pseudomonas parasichuanensis]|uniref:hypothetical protein n=1 Tax=Pseudomonas parasichuanensis TaxID=2892329 RepID=UPI001F23CFAE|nr:hypothetical protein [Pseudomonas parasichuanensis]
MHNVELKINKAVDPRLNESGQRVLSYLYLATFAVFAILAIRYQYYLLDYAVFGDEAETIVAAKMMVAGQKLYSEIFNHHGPLTFLTGYLLESFGSFSVPGHRVPVAILQVVSMLAVYYSPLLRGGLVKKAYVMLASSVLLLYFADNFGSMYMYQILAGLLLVIILSQYALPAIAEPQLLGRKWVFAGNVLIACLPFLAITYAPIAVLLLLASLRRSYLKVALVGLMVGVALNLAFLLITGSIAGYLAYHIYLNSQVLSLYNGGQSGFNLIMTAFNAGTANLAGFTLFSVVVFAIIRLAQEDSRIPWRSILVGLGAGSLLIRGLGLHGVPFYYMALALPLIFFVKPLALAFQARLVLLLLLWVCLLKVSLLLPGDKQRLLSKKNPAVTEFSQLVQRLTDKDDKIIAYSFNNHEYLAANRLPASGYYFYLPWQEKYNESPRYGVRIDACEQIAQNRPKVMLINKWKVWDKYPWDSYAGCVQSLIDKEYVQIPGRPFYVRKDLYQNLLRSTREGFVAQRQGAENFLHDVVKLPDGSYKITGGDPYVVFGLPEASQNHADDYLAMDLTCLAPRSTDNILMEVFWRNAAMGFKQTNSFTFNAHQGTTVLNLSRVILDAGSTPLKEVRLDFPSASTCAVVALKNVELGAVSP